MHSLGEKICIICRAPICKQITSCSASFPAEDAIELGEFGDGAAGEAAIEVAIWDSVAGCVSSPPPLPTVSCIASTGTT